MGSFCHLQPLGFTLLTLFLLDTHLLSLGATAASGQNLCANTTVVRTRTQCHSCSISALIPCRSGFKQSPGSIAKDCKYMIKTGSFQIGISGCSFECYKEVEEKQCCPGFWGPDCIECPEHAANPCSNNGVCSEGMGGNGTCNCKEGYTGTACEDCAANRYGLTCKSVCTCVHGLCSAGMQGDGTCLCFSGYKGPNCDQEMPECAALSCQDNSRCMEEAMTGRLVCSCMPGYQSAGAQCISINPCLKKMCHTHATCAHTGPDQHLCTCAEGYSGDGHVCMAIDPCQANMGGCIAGTTQCLYDGPGKSHCECLYGFANMKDGVCSLKDVCRPDTCHKNANCATVEPGTFQCTCNQGYLGNGLVCYGNIMQRLNELNTEPGGQWTSQLSSAITLFNVLSWPLTSLGPFTVFVPINKGFRGTSLKGIMADSSKAKYLCKLHLVAGEMAFDTLKAADVYYTLTGKAGEADTADGGPCSLKSTVSALTSVYTNKIGPVLGGKPSGEADKCVLCGRSRTEALYDFVLLVGAPHWQDGSTKIRIHGSRRKGTIVQSDVIASNGKIHIINRLMDSVSPTVESNKEENLMKILSDNGKFSQFKTLLEKANLASVMDLPGPYTVFAPTNAAFDAMNDGHLQYLSSAEGSRKLVELLRNHIVASTALEVYNIASSPRVVTMANQVLSFNVTRNGQIQVNGMSVLEADVEAMNGRLYSLDGVLTPSSIEPVLPQRCDITENKIIKGECVSCSKIKSTKCPNGVPTESVHFGCAYPITISTTPPLTLAATGCSLLCNATVTTPVCCKGFYGPDCSPCPGGFQTPCSNHGQCMEGIEGNGTCICEANFRGSKCHYCADPSRYGPSCDKSCDCIHGQCDNRPEATGRCKVGSCLTGYTGPYCERRTQACGAQVQYCHAHADCDFNEGATKCVCKDGYQGDGITCVEADPCAPPLRGGCSVNAKCIKTGPGTHSCQCLAGWKEDGDECQASNNCDSAERGGCHPNASCIYVGPGQSDCMCKSGYRGNGRDCEAVNRCVTPSGGCHLLASCRMLSGQWKCVCDEGYGGNGEVCYGTVEQKLIWLPQATEFIKWVTDAGLSQSLSEQNITLLLPSSEAIAKMSKDDRDFWMAKGNLPSIVRNHMILGNYPLSALRNTSSLPSLLKTTLVVSTSAESTAIGGATIVTENVAATNGLIHIIDKVLVPERKMSEGLLELLALRPEFSLFRSYLVQHNLTDEVEQADEYTIFAPIDAAVNDYLKQMAATAMDVNTTRYHILLSERLLKTELQGYKETMLGFSYQLAIFSRDGKVFVNEAQVNVSNIMTGKGVIHGLTSVLEINRNRCDKAQNRHIMGTCQDCFTPQEQACTNGSIPLKSVIRRRCMFSRIYDNERLLTMGCKTVCVKTNIMRKCCSGFFGEHCEPCPGPKDQACFGNGVCVDGTNGTGVCQCSPGFNGTACETCQTGKYGIHCDQECACKNGRCKDGLKGDGTCDCSVGWRGVFCDEKIESKADELCGSVKCHTSANCVIKPSAMQCVCAAGFEGNGTYCQAKDACAQDNGGCSVYAVCKRTQAGRRDCVCNPGYTGDGLVCVEINPCLEGNGGCDVNADCIHNGPNKTSCACNNGYEGDGKSCKMIDLCRKKNGDCHRYASCNMSGPGVRTCMCPNNFIGDGIICKGTVGKELITRKLRDFYLGLMISEISLKGRGPFTVFAPSADAFLKDRNGSNRMKGFLVDKHREKYAEVLRNHIVMCHILLPSDLSTPRNITTMAGEVVTTRLSEGSLFINEANVTYSDGVSANGILHEVDTILFPSSVAVDKDKEPALQILNLTNIADRHGYKTFYKLLEDTGVMELVNDPTYQPVTVFLPSDAVMDALSQQQKDFLYSQDNKPQLVEYLKYHIIYGQKVFSAELIHLELARTLQGSQLTFSCGGMDNIGEVYINGGKCRLIQRHLLFGGGVAYGIDCLLTPPSLGGRCDDQRSFELQMNCGPCTASSTRCPSGSKVKEVKKCDLPMMYITKNTGCQAICTVNFWQSKCCAGYYGRDCLACPGGSGSICSNHGKCDDGHLGNGTCKCDEGFQGVACERCNEDHFGPNCAACNCTEHGYCEGTGVCFCQEGWTGKSCETQLTDVPQCSPACFANAVCKENNTCVCRPFYVGDGFTCTVADMCSIWNGGCAKVAKCSQTGEKVSCACPKGHSGDGFSCQPIDPCASLENGGCHEHATCTMTGPGKKRCTCKDNYVGDGVTCEVKDLPLDRCLQNNGLCHQDAQCSDLHFEDSTAGVFHYRSANGQYKLNYTAAQETCIAEGATLATYTQLSYAQQAGLNLCAASWLDQARVSYPTTYANPNCGFGHVGIVDYGTRKNLSETWDAFCYRMKEVKCECKAGYIGDGSTCTGNLLQVLTSRPSFSNFLTQVLNYSQVSESGREFMRRLSNLGVQSTLFVPDNTELWENQTLSQRDIEYHLSEGQALPLSELRNGSRIRTRLGSLTVYGIADFLNPTVLASRYINDRFITDSDILASNGIIHVLRGALKAPPPRQTIPVAHKASLGVGVVLLVILVAGVIFVGYHFYTHKTKPFQFHYFKDEGEVESSPPDCDPSICNPVYDGGPEPAAAEPTSSAAEDKHEVVNGGPYDLLQDS